MIRMSYSLRKMIYEDGAANVPCGKDSEGDGNIDQERW